LIENLVAKLQNNDSFLSLETTPSKASNIDNIINPITKLSLANKVDAFSTTDSPLSKLKYSALISAYKIQNKFKKPVLCTVSMRDRNIIALQSDLLGAIDLDVRLMLSLTGDPAKMSDQKNAKSVLEGNSLKYMDIINAFNKGEDISGHKLSDTPKKTYAIGVINSYAKDWDRLQKKIEKKIEKNPIAIITQPIFSEDIADKMIEIFNNALSKFDGDRAKCKLIFGFFPVVRYKTALFLSEKVPGIHISDIWLDELKKAFSISKEKEYEVGYNLSKNMLNYLHSKIKRIHMMTANNFELADKLIQNMGK